MNKVTNRRFAGANWIKEQYPQVEVSPLGEAVADLLGDLFCGIYHLSHKTLAKTMWSNKYFIAIDIADREFATVDFDLLTVIAVLAHDRMLRVSISAHTFRSLRLIFHQRAKRDGGTMESCPTIEEHIQTIRKRYE